MKRYHNFLLLNWRESVSFLLSITMYFSSVVAQDSSPENRNAKIQGTLLPDTGQTVRYTQSFGEDSDYAGVQPSYTDNEDGTITDNVTGLMWQKTDGGEMTWEKARQYANDCQLGGYSDWRLPHSNELFSIMDHGRHGPAMNTEVFTKTEARYWWTGVTRPDDSSKVWVVNTGGGIGSHAKSETVSAGGERPIHVRVVRGTSSLGTGPRFQENGNGSITDNSTGLMWQKLSTQEGMTWEDALAACGKLDLAGHKDWRLPNIKELRSISDDSKVRPSLDITFFPNAQAKIYWSSSSQSNRPQRAWFVDFVTGLVSYSDKTEKHLAIAVRDNHSTPGTKDKSPPDASLLEQSSRKGQQGSGNSKKLKNQDNRRKMPQPNKPIKQESSR